LFNKVNIQFVLNDRGTALCLTSLWAEQKLQDIHWYQAEKNTFEMHKVNALLLFSKEPHYE